MISTKIAKLKINLATYTYNGCLFLYYDKDNKIENDIGLMKFVDSLFIEAKVKKYDARIMIKTDENKYISNKAYLEDFYDHPLENHIVIFKDKKLVGYTPLEDIIKLYESNREQ